MIDVDFFVKKRLLFARRSVISPQECTQICREIDVSPGGNANVYLLNGHETTHNFRKTRQVIISEETHHKHLSLLMSFKSQIEQFFDLTLSGCESPQFLKYETGDYFKPHQDRGHKTNQEAYERKVSLILFLNQSDYEGGHLVFYDLLPKHPVFGKKSVGLPLKVEPGLFIAFHPDILHEVKPVTKGQRYSIVSWYY